MKPGDVVVGSFPGAQVTKVRPGVVLPTEDYHRHRPDVIVGIITSQDPKPASSMDCPLADWKAAGLHSTSYFRLFLVTLPRSNVRLIGRLSESDWKAVRDCFQNGLVPH